MLSYPQPVSGLALWALKVIQSRTFVFWLLLLIRQPHASYKKPFIPSNDRTDVMGQASDPLYPPKLLPISQVPTSFSGHLKGWELDGPIV